MRISTKNFYDSYLKNIVKNENKIEKYTNQLSSGKKLNLPSDSPIDNFKITKFKTFQNDIKGYLNNIDKISNIQTFAEESMDNIIDSALEGREELIRLHNLGVLDQEDANIVKDYLQSIKKYIIDLSNKEYGSNYIFSGEKIDIKPFNEDGTYNGSNVESTTLVSKNIEVRLNYNGEESLGVYEITDNDTNTTQKKLAITAAIDKIVEIIDSGDLTQLNEEKFTVNGKNYTPLDLYDLGYNKILEERSYIGNESKFVEDIKEQHKSFDTKLSDIISNIEDADISEVIIQLEKTKLSYEAILASFNQNKELTLLKYF